MKRLNLLTLRGVSLLVVMAPLGALAEHRLIENPAAIRCDIEAYKSDGHEPDQIHFEIFDTTDGTLLSLSRLMVQSSEGRGSKIEDQAWIKKQRDRFKDLCQLAVSDTQKYSFDLYAKDALEISLPPGQEFPQYTDFFTIEKKQSRENPHEKLHNYFVEKYPSNPYGGALLHCQNKTDEVAQLQKAMIEMETQINALNYKVMEQKREIKNLKSSLRHKEKTLF